MLRAACVLLLFISLCAAQNGNNQTKDAVLQADLRILGWNVLPFNTSRQNAVIVGVANVLGNGVVLSDISLTVLNTYDNMTAYGNRRLLQAAYPAVDTRLRVQTESSVAQQQQEALSQGTNVTYSLAGAIGAQGLQTQQIVLLSSEIQSGAAPETAPPPTPPPQPTPSNPPTAPQPSEGPEGDSPGPVASPQAPSPPPLDSGSVTSTAAKSGTGSSSLSGGAIAGIAIGAAAVLALLALGGFFVMRRRARRAQYNEDLAMLNRRAKPGPSDGNFSNIVAYGSPNFAPRGAAGQQMDATGGARMDDKAEHGLATEKIEV